MFELVSQGFALHCSLDTVVFRHYNSMPLNINVNLLLIERVGGT